MLHVLYIVHDISDATVRRRVLMLQAGGAAVTLAGFRRSAQPVGDVAGLTPIDLGATEDGRFAQRIGAILKGAFSAGSHFAGVLRPDVIVARNLESLAIATRVKARFAGAAIPIVYESLDIHRLLLRHDVVGYMLRQAERRLASGVGLLLTSSPAFVDNYFRPYGQVTAPVEMVENKLFAPRGAPPLKETAVLTSAPPWRIGWFGALRCRHSLDVLTEAADVGRGRLEIVLRGRPALREFADFQAQVSAAPHVSFLGPYRNPEEMEEIYTDVHFSWAIDLFEAGLNSDWLRPCRLYESCGFATVPIALRRTETGRFMAEQGIGILLEEASPQALAEALAPVDAHRYAQLRQAIAEGDRRRWIHDERDCRALVARLAGLVREAPPALALAG